MAKRIPTIPKVINLYGGPGIGKTAVASRIASEFLFGNKDITFITSSAKTLNSLGYKASLGDQKYIAKIQFEAMMRAGTKYIVTTGPLLQCLHYLERRSVPQEREKKQIEEFIEVCRDRFDNVDILLQRGNQIEYNPDDQPETLQEAKEIDEKIKGILDHSDINYEEFPVDKRIVDDQIMQYVLTAIAHFEAKDVFVSQFAEKMK